MAEPFSQGENRNLAEETRRLISGSNTSFCTSGDSSEGSSTQGSPEARLRSCGSASPPRAPGTRGPSHHVLAQTWLRVLCARYPSVRVKLTLSLPSGQNYAHTEAWNRLCGVSSLMVNMAPPTGTRGKLPQTPTNRRAQLQSVHLNSIRAKRTPSDDLSFGKLRQDDLQDGKGGCPTLLRRQEQPEQHR